MLASCILGLLPARYLVRLVGLVVGGTFWHVIPIVVAIPASERRRYVVSNIMTHFFVLTMPASSIPPPFSFVPSDTEYAMELISQRVARGLPVKAKRKRPGTQSLDSNMPEAEGAQGSSSSVDWKKVGERMASTREMASDVKGLFREGQVSSSHGSWTA